VRPPAPSPHELSTFATVRRDLGTPQVSIVIPCYNESSRLSIADVDQFLAAKPNAQIVFVDDGSTDGTADLISGLPCVRTGRCHLLRLSTNRGKAEAVRTGLLAAIDHGSRFVGFWDADLSTPLICVDSFLAILEQHSEIDWVIGARVRLMGRDIRRRTVRHYVGRLFATAASLALQLPVYDTQCGAKLFRATPELRTLLSREFISRWIFDVELIARLILSRRESKGAAVEHTIYEYPVERWQDVRGSKLRPQDFGRAVLDMARIWLMLRASHRTA
jgi:dolichyl-phosphate beta-glucosyltransferase